MAGTQEMPTQEVEAEEEEGGTQPMEDQGESQKDTSWAKLMPIDPHFTATSLTEAETSFGRTDPNGAPPPPGHIYIGSPKWEFNAAISKRQFTIRRGPKEQVFIVDTSSNGTFVNGTRIPKNGQRPLPPNAEIAIALAKNRVFIFYVKDGGKKYPPELSAAFDITRELGKGAMGTVHRGFRKSDGGTVAVKEVQKHRFNPTSARQLEREVEILKAIRHPACISVEAVFEDPSATYIVMDCVEGGELFDRIVKHKRLPENISKLYAVQMMEAIAYLHGQGIVHRDLKPENILLTDAEELVCGLKVTDFGLSKMFEAESMMKTFCGTPNYLAPEIVKSGGSGSYTKAVDLWSAGVIAFVCLAGYPPFSKDYTDMSLDKQITSGRIKFVEREWKGISADARNFVESLIVVDPDQRLTAEDALAHPWIALDTEVLSKAHEIMYPEGRDPSANGDASSSQENGRGPRKRGVKKTLDGGDEMDVDANASSQPKRSKE